MYKTLITLILFILTFTGIHAQDCKISISKLDSPTGIVIQPVAANNTSGRIKSVRWNIGVDADRLTITKPGKYCAIVVFESGCKAESCIEIENINNPQCSIEIKREIGNVTNFLCVYSKNPNDPIQSVRWNTGQNEKCIPNPGFGTFCVKAVTRSGCETSTCITQDSTSERCAVEIVRNNDALNPTLCARVKAGTNAVKIEWSTGSNDECIRLDTFGTVCVLITTADGCQARDCITIPYPECKVDIVHARNNVRSTICAVTPPNLKVEKYRWSNGSEDSCIDAEEGGEFCVSVLFSNGCEAKTCIKVDPTPKYCRADIFVKFNSDSTIILCAKADTTGQVKAIKWNTGSTEECIVPERNGEYCVTISYAGGCEAVKCMRFNVASDTCRVKIVRTANENNRLVLCAETGPNEEIKSYLWSNGSTASCIQPSSPGEYCVKVILANGCEAKACVTFNPPFDSCRVEIVRIPTPTDDMMLCADAGPTDDIKKYLWSNGSEQTCIRPNVSGRYCVTVGFANGCTVTKCVDVVVPQDSCKFRIEKSVTSTGIILTVLSRPDADIEFIGWNTGDSTRSILVTENGSYCAKIQLANGCSGSVCTEVGGLNCSVSIRRLEGNYLIAHSLGYRSATYVWSTGETTQKIQVTDKESYCVTITTPNGCEATACFDFDPAVPLTNKFNPRNSNTSSTITSIDNNEQELGSAIYAQPNPATSSIRLSPSGIHDGEGWVEVYDFSGRVIIRQPYRSLEALKTMELNLDGHQEGMYVVRVKNETGIISTKVLKIQ